MKFLSKAPKSLKAIAAVAMILAASSAVAADWYYCNGYCGQQAGNAYTSAYNSTYDSNMHSCMAAHNSDMNYYSSCDYYARQAATASAQQAYSNAYYSCMGRCTY